MASCGGSAATLSHLPSHLPVLSPQAHVVAASSPVASAPASKYGFPAVLISAAEAFEGRLRLRFALMAKFSGGCPPLAEMQLLSETSWMPAGAVSFGLWDPRHFLVILQSDEDVARALSCPVRLVGTRRFRIFRWSAAFSARREPSLISTWVKLPGLPLELFDEGCIGRIVGQVGSFVAVDAATKSFSRPSVARACVEVDAVAARPSKIWVAREDGSSFWQRIVFEDRLLFCSSCKVHGHAVSECRKARIRVSPVQMSIVPSTAVQVPPPQSSAPSLAGPPRQRSFLEVCLASLDRAGPSVLNAGAAAFSPARILPFAPNEFPSAAVEAGADAGEVSAASQVRVTPPVAQALVQPPFVKHRCGSEGWLTYRRCKRRLSPPVAFLDGPFAAMVAFPPEVDRRLVASVEPSCAPASLAPFAVIPVRSCSESPSVDRPRGIGRRGASPRKMQVVRSPKGPEDLVPTHELRSYTAKPVRSAQDIALFKTDRKAELALRKAERKRQRSNRNANFFFED